MCTGNSYVCTGFAIRDSDVLSYSSPFQSLLLIVKLRAVPPIHDDHYFLSGLAVGHNTDPDSWLVSRVKSEGVIVRQGLSDP